MAKTSISQGSLDNTPPPPNPVFLCNLALFSAEAVHGLRRVASLSNVVSPFVIKQLLLQQEIITNGRTRAPVITWCSKAPRVRTYSQKADCVDCVAVLMRDKRTFAITMRLRFAHGKWRAEEITIL